MMKGSAKKLGCIIFFFSLIFSGIVSGQELRIVSVAEFESTVPASEELLHYAPPEVNEKNKKALNKIISVDLHNVPMEGALRRIAELGGFRIAYSKSMDITNARWEKPVSVNLARATVLGALYAALGDTDLRLTLSSTSGNSQLVVVKSSSRKVMPLTLQEEDLYQDILRGQVIDSETNEPLPGVNILVKGTTTGTTTDNSGEFELTVPSLSDTLVISYIGYVQLEVPIDGRTDLSIEMESQRITGEEVVVVGYGTMERRDVTGSISRVEADKISNTSVTRLDQALQGKSSGVKVTSIDGAPGSGTTIRIRGGNSISASNEPLYVVDGFIGGGGDLNTINPDDIESINILKDASATAIYGSQGANGVILITTKKGRPGDVRVNLRSSTGWQEVADKIEFLTGPERARYANEAAEAIGREIPFENPDAVGHYDWIDRLTQRAPMRELSMNVSGGTEDTRYYLSGNYLTQDGIVLNSGFDRIQSRLNVDKQVKDWLDLDTQLNISRTNRMNSTVGMANLQNTQTFIPFRRDDGSFTFVDPVSGFPFSNPIAEAELEKDNTFRTRLQGNLGITLNPTEIENLEVRSRVGVDLNAVKRNEFESGRLPLRQDEGRGAFGSVATNNNWNILSETTAEYQQTIDENNRFNIMGGITFQHFENEFASLSADNIPSDALSFNSLEIGDPEQRSINTGFTDWTLLSYFGRVNYTLRDKYLFTFTSRLDGSSRLAERNKWAYFPSAAFAWQIGSEPFMENVDIVSQLKLRISVGKSGNQAISEYGSLARLQPTSAFFNQSEQVAFRQGDLANPNLRWETTRQLDVGLDAGILNNRIILAVDYYYKQTRDLLLERELPFQTGFSTRLENVGEVQNKGLEFSMDAQIIQSSDLIWDFQFNISGNRNKVMDLGGEDFIDLNSGARLIPGEVGASFYGAVYEGTWKSQEEIDANPNFMPDAQPGFPRFSDVNGNGTFDEAGDFAIIGNYQADFFGGFSNTIRYKDFQLDADFHYSYGNEIMNIDSGANFFGRFFPNIFAIARNRWSPDNPDSDIPKAGSEVVADYRMPSSAMVKDGSFLRLKNVRLTYWIPLEIVGASNSRASIYFTGTNLLTWDNYEFGWDPEVSARGTDPVQQGFDSTTYPTAKTYVIGISYEF